MPQNIDARIFKEFLQYDLTSGSLWEIVEIFERHRARFRDEISQYQEEITKAKKELGELREQLSQARALQAEHAAPKPQNPQILRQQSTQRAMREFSSQKYRI